MKNSLQSRAALLAATVGMVVSVFASALPASALISGINSRPQSSWEGFNGRVSTATIAAGRIYVGGAFDYVGQPNGSALLYNSDGTINRLPIEGEVNQSVTDEQGRWYVAGAFKSALRSSGVAGQSYLLRLHANGTLDTSWRPVITGGQVTTISLIKDSTGSTRAVFVAGTFGSLNGSTSVTGNIGQYAVVDIDSGATKAGPFQIRDPLASAVTMYPKTSLAVSVGTNTWRVYYGGKINDLRSVSRGFLRQMTITANGSVFTATSHTSIFTTEKNSARETYSNAVSALAVNPTNSVLYFGGVFGSVYMQGSTTPQARQNVGALNIAAGSLVADSLWRVGTKSDLATTRGKVDAMTSDPAGNIYIGGEFTDVTTNNTPESARSGLAVVNGAGTLSPRTFPLSSCYARHITGSYLQSPTCVPGATALYYDSAQSNLYVAGNFRKYNGVDSRFTTVIDATGAMLPSVYDPSAVVLGEAPNSFQPNASKTAVLVSGSMTSSGGSVRPFLTALTMSGVRENNPAFTPSIPDGPVISSVVSPDGNSVYIAGAFKNVGGVRRVGVARLHAQTGQLDTSFNARLNTGEVETIALVNNTLYIGGTFTKKVTVNGVGYTLNKALKLQASTGDHDPNWLIKTTLPTGPISGNNLNGAVRSIVTTSDGNVIGLAGAFGTFTINTSGDPASTSGITLTNMSAVMLDGSGRVLKKQLNVLNTDGRCSGANPRWFSKLYVSPDNNYLYAGDICPDYIYKYSLTALGNEVITTASQMVKQNPVWLQWADGGFQAGLEIPELDLFLYGTHGAVTWTGPHQMSTSDRCYTLRPDPLLCPTVSGSRMFSYSATSGNVASWRPEFDSYMGVWDIKEIPGSGVLVTGDFQSVYDPGTSRKDITPGVAFYPYLSQ